MMEWRKRTEVTEDGLEQRMTHARNVCCWEALIGRNRPKRSKDEQD
jgi:hypothetical protein